VSKVLLNKKKKNYAKLIKKASIIAVSTIILAVIALYIVFTKSGQWLVNDDEFKHVKWVVILDGQSADMERNDFAAELVAQGKADSVLIMGRRVLRDRSNAEFYSDDSFAIQVLTAQPFSSPRMTTPPPSAKPTRLSPGSRTARPTQSCCSRQPPRPTGYLTCSRHSPAKAPFS